MFLDQQAPMFFAVVLIIILLANSKKYIPKNPTFPYKAKIRHLDNVFTVSVILEGTKVYHSLYTGKKTYKDEWVQYNDTKLAENEAQRLHNFYKSKEIKNESNQKR